MRILLTGSSGWLGRFLAPMLRGAGYSVIGLDVAPGTETAVVGSVADPGTAARDAVSRGYTAIKVGGVERTVARAEAIRAARGADVDLMVDLHGPPWMPTADATAVCRALEPLAPLFVEEPLAPENIEG